MQYDKFIARSYTTQGRFEEQIYSGSLSGAFQASMSSLVKGSSCIKIFGLIFPAQLTLPPIDADIIEPWVVIKPVYKPAPKPVHIFTICSPTIPY